MFTKLDYSAEIDQQNDYRVVKRSGYHHKWSVAAGGAGGYLRNRRLSLPQDSANLGINKVYIGNTKGNDC